MILEIMRETNNFFVNPSQIEEGYFEIENGIIELDEYYLVGQYIAITGSILHNGIYLLTDKLYTLTTTKTNEGFEGAIYGLVIPPDFLALVEQIKEFQENPQNRPSIYTSERFGIDSRSRFIRANGAPPTWKSVFSEQLAKYRTMFRDIDI